MRGCLTTIRCGAQFTRGARSSCTFRRRPRNGCVRSVRLPATFGQEPHAAVVIPLAVRQETNVGALVLFHEVSDGDPSPDLLAFAKALSGTIAVAIENQSLLQAQKALLESFIRLVAGAIDAKSPYTGGHCQRVPVLTRMLAEAACEARTGPFRDFAMTEEEWEALHIATWLHDCGKVTTPEHVVDKATKLETIYNRLHEIRMRFEVIKRDCRNRVLAAYRRRRRSRDAVARARCGSPRARRRVRLRCSLQRRRRVDRRRHRRTAAQDRQANMAADARRSHRSCHTTSVRARMRLPRRRCRSPSTCSADKPEHRIERSDRRADARSQSLGLPPPAAAAQEQPRRAVQPLDRPRHADRGGSIPDQRSHRTHDHDAVRAAVHCAPEACARNGRRTSRTHGWQGLPEGTVTRRNERAGAHDGDRRRLRSAHRRGPAVQETQDTVRIDTNHGEDARRAPSRSRISSISSSTRTSIVRTRRSSSIPRKTTRSTCAVTSARDRGRSPAAGGAD